MMTEKRYRGHYICHDERAREYLVYYCGILVFKSSTEVAAKEAVDSYHRWGSYGYYVICG